MIFNNQLLFFFSALGAFNGLLLSFYFLFFAKPRHISNRFLGAFLLMLSIRVGKSVAFYFNPDLSFIFLQFGLSVCLFIGPFLYFYIKSVIQPQSNILKSWIYHIILLISVASIIGYMYPFDTNVGLWRPYFIYTIYLEWLGYTIVSGLLLKKYSNKLFFDNKKLKDIGIWILTIYGGNTIILISYFLFSYTYYIVGALSFSFLFYLLMLLIFFSKKDRSYLYMDVQKYMNKKINDIDASVLTKRLNLLLTKKKLHQDPVVKLSDIANHLNILPHHLSQFLNDNLGKSFSLFINEYRIEEAKRLLISNTNYTIEAIGYDCGFNSKSTFFTTFKKITGTTPANYKIANSQQVKVK